MPKRKRAYHGISNSRVHQSRTRTSTTGHRTGLPVFDVVTLVHWLHRSLATELFVRLKLRRRR